MSLNWETTASYILPARTTDGRYQIACRVGGSRGPVYQAQFIAGLGVGVSLGDVQETVSEAQALCQAHADELAKEEVRC